MIPCPECGGNLTEIQNVKPYQSTEFEPKDPKLNNPKVKKRLKNWSDPRRYIAYWCDKHKGWVWDRVF